MKRKERKQMEMEDKQRGKEIRAEETRPERRRGKMSQKGREWEGNKRG